MVHLHFIFNCSMHATGRNSCWVRKNTGKDRSWDHLLRQFQWAVEIILIHGDRWNWAHGKSDDSDPLRCFFLHWIQEPHEFDSSTLTLRGQKKLFHKCRSSFFLSSESFYLREHIFMYFRRQSKQLHETKLWKTSHPSFWNVTINFKQEYSSGTLFPGGEGLKY